MYLQIFINAGKKLQYQQENKITNEEIIGGWNVGLNTLDAQIYGHLFTGSLQVCLAKKLYIKKKWICMVSWATTGDRVGDIVGRHRNPELVQIYDI